MGASLLALATFKYYNSVYHWWNSYPWRLTRKEISQKRFHFGIFFYVTKFYQK